MAHPHPALIDLAAGREAGLVAVDSGFVESAIEHRVAGLASWAASAGLIDIDAASRRALAAVKLATVAHNMKVAETAASVVAELQSSGWDAAVFKGVATEARWYPELGTRPAGDVDLMLSPPSCRALDEIVAKLAPGHRLEGKVQRLVDLGRLQSVDLQWHGVWVDVHTDPVKIGIPLPGNAELWDRAAPLVLGDRLVPALDAEASLLQAAIHLQKDRFSRLYGFVDVARIAQSGELDWAWLQGFAAEAGLAVHLNETLRVVAETLRIDLPIRSDSRSAIWRAVWPERTRLRGAVGMTRRVRTHYWIPLSMPGRRTEAVTWWGRVVFPPADVVDYMHPDTSGPYLWRLVQYRTALARERHNRNRQQRRAADL